MPSSVLTDEELLQLPRDGHKYEVVDGELRMSPAGAQHERVVPRLLIRLGAFVEQHGLGDVLGSNMLYVLPSGNKRAPDVSFVAAGRFTAEARAEVFPHLVPDLAVEVLSPNDRTRAVLDRVGEYLEAGVRLVWVIDPDKQRGTVHRSASEAREIRATASIDGEEVVPGFRCPLEDLFA